MISWFLTLKFIIWAQVLKWIQELQQNVCDDYIPQYIQTIPARQNL